MTSARTEMVPLKEIAQKILEKTEDGKLLWSELGNNAFLTNIGDNSVVISKQGNYFERAFRNSEGHILEEIDTGRPEYYEINLNDLYEIVRRQALRVDEALM